MPSRLWVNDDGSVCVVEVDDKGNRVDPAPPVKEPEPEPEQPPKKRGPGRPRKT